MTCCVLLWEFNIIPSPTSVTIRPPKLDILEDILNDLLLVNEMPGDVESIGAEGGVTDMDKIDEIQQLTQLLGVEQATGDAKYMNDSSSD